MLAQPSSHITNLLEIHITLTSRPSTRSFKFSGPESLEMSVSFTLEFRCSNSKLELKSRL
jgi:hypothetical protein